MSVQFDEENNFSQSVSPSMNYPGNASSVPGLTGWLIKRGWAKNESQANTLMVIVAIICFGLAIFFAIG